MRKQQVFIISSQFNTMTVSSVIGQCGTWQINVAVVTVQQKSGYFFQFQLSSVIGTSERAAGCQIEDSLDGKFVFSITPLYFFLMETSTGIFKKVIVRTHAHTHKHIHWNLHIHTTTLRQNPPAARVLSINRVCVRSPHPPSLPSSTTNIHIICHGAAQPKTGQAAFKVLLN